ncbi:MAG: hypothetical protein H6R19_944 [Proteobacteria bacterium]|nr:hypothetical protein [Pseudomonadota bacterium]
MQQIHDADVLLLQAITLAAKRKPAAINEVVVAVAMLQPHLPSETKLREAFARLSSHGLIVAQDEGYTLSAEAERLLAGTSKKGDANERAYRIKEKLAEFDVGTAHPVVQPDDADLSAAILAWRASLPPLTKTEKFEARKEKAKEVTRANNKVFGRPGRPRITH